jgi:acyl-CoA reductase-like NAD-dependent aldehyde dehydrogenase
MLIDGKLVDGESGTFANVNPATEEEIGVVADASATDMHRAINAARRAFDETDWSSNRAFRQHCLRQLQSASSRSKRRSARNSSERWDVPAWSPTALSSTCHWPTP